MNCILAIRFKLFPFLAACLEFKLNRNFVEAQIFADSVFQKRDVSLRHRFWARRENDERHWACSRLRHIADLEMYGSARRRRIFLKPVAQRVVQRGSLDSAIRLFVKFKRGVHEAFHSIAVQRGSFHYRREAHLPEQDRKSVV